MRRLWLVLFVVALVAMNAWLVSRAWHGAGGAARRVDNERLKSSREDAGQRKRALALISDWNSGRAVSIASEELLAAVAQMPRDGCITLPPGGVPVGDEDLTPVVVGDLGEAICGLLRAYSAGSPDAILDYMKERGKVMNPARRPAYVKSLTKLGQTGLDDAPDEDLFRRLWTIRMTKPSWESLIENCSCRQVWNGSAVSQRSATRISVDERFATGSTATDLDRMLRGHVNYGHSFQPNDAESRIMNPDEPLRLLADVVLVIGFDDDRYQVRTGYLVRFWHNPNANKWQPIALVGFASDPDRLSLPPLMF